MSGTRWTEPGQGATKYSLRCALAKSSGLGVTLDTIYKQVPIVGDTLYFRTNLALTGEPLTAEDVENIGRAK